MNEIKVKNNQFRCVCFLNQELNTGPEGQQMSMYLPSGKYSVHGVETISTSSFGKLSEVQAFRLHRKENVYYISTKLKPEFKQLFTTTKEL